MAGPAIRAWNMALQLHVDNDVILLTTDRLGEVTAPFDVTQISSGDNARFRSLERWAEVIVFQGHALSQFSALRRTKKILVADI